MAVRSEVAPRVLPLALGTDSPKLHSKASRYNPGVSSQGYRDNFVQKALSTWSTSRH